MSRVLARSLVAVMAVLIGFGGAPAAADAATAAATSVLYLARVGEETEGHVLQADAAHPDATFFEAAHYVNSDLHSGWGLGFFGVEDRAHVRGDGSSISDLETHFAIQDSFNHDPVLRLNGVNHSVSCTDQAIWLGTVDELRLFGRHGGAYRELPITFDQPITLDNVYPGDVYHAEPGDTRLTTMTLSRITKLADLAGYPQFAHYSRPAGVQGYRLRIEQRETESSPVTTYDFLVGVVVCRP
jgi:hypothetical protein